MDKNEIFSSVSSTNYFLLNGKSSYHKSRIDDKLYCKTNGKLALHFKKNEISDAEYVEKFLDQNSSCDFCSMRAQLDKVSWKWLSTCGNRECVNKQLTQLKLANYADESKKASILGKLRATMTSDRKLEIAAKIKLSLTPDKLEKAKLTRRQTCETLYGDPTYSNAHKITEVKANVSPNEQLLINQRRNNTNRNRYGTVAVLGAITSKFEREAIAALIDRGYDAHTYLHPKGQYFISGVGASFSLYDYVNVTSKKIIEFNGDYWHANPKKYLAEDIIGRGITRKTAKLVWDKDYKKHALAIAKGFQVLTIWESDYHFDKNATIERCIAWLKT